MIHRMHAPQYGIFALGTAAHAYLELDLHGGAPAGELVSAVADLREPRRTVGGVNLVAGFRPAMGRTKLDSVELEDLPPASHVARTDQDRFGEVFRRNMPYGTTTDHGTMFVGFSAEQRRLAGMLESMAGLGDGVRDVLTSYTRPLTGAYYFVPSAQDLGRFASA
jgi:hypothetical protein